MVFDPFWAYRQFFRYFLDRTAFITAHFKNAAGQFGQSLEGIIDNTGYFRREYFLQLTSL